MNESAIPEALACPSCGGRLEAAAKVYFDLTAAARSADGELAITGIEIAELNDSFDGHPAALESELVVSCKDCGEGAEFRLAGAALARAQFHRALPANSELELAEELSVVPLISLVYGEADVRDYAVQAGVDEALALRRAREWGKHIQDTAAGLCAEQLLSVVASGQP